MPASRADKQEATGMKAKCMWMAGLLAGALCSPVAAAEFTLKWGEDFDAAKASAKEKTKHDSRIRECVLANHTIAVFDCVKSSSRYAIAQFRQHNAIPAPVGYQTTQITRLKSNLTARVISNNAHDTVLLSSVAMHPI